jgi:hypothetical protein
METDGQFLRALCPVGLMESRGYVVLVLALEQAHIHCKCNMFVEEKLHAERRSVSRAFSFLLGRLIFDHPATGKPGPLQGKCREYIELFARNIR